MDWGQLAPLIIPGLVAGMCGICGAVVGALLTAGLAFGQSWVNRRWRAQQVRTAEKRARSEDRFEPVRTYALGLQEFVHEAVGMVQVREWRTQAGGWGGSAQAVEQDLNKRMEDAEALRPRPGPYYILRDTAGFESLLKLQLEASICQLKCLECVWAGQAMTGDMANGFLQGADNALDKLLTRMDELVEQLEP